MLTIRWLFFFSFMASAKNQTWHEEFDEYLRGVMNDQKYRRANITRPDPDYLLDSCTGGITTLHWNAHVGRGCDGQCAKDAISALQSMASVVDAKIVGAVELNNAYLSGYSSTGQAIDDHNDATTIFVKNGFGSIVEHHGFMLIYDGARKGGEAARIKLNQPIGGCSEICVAAFHIPHPGQSGSGGWENKSKQVVKDTCSGVNLNSCGIGIGDWNRDMNSAPGKMYAFGFGGNAVGGPYDGTCCEGSHPDIGGYGGASFDHTITNMPGAKVTTVKIFGYPVAGDYVHNPVSMCIRTSGPSPPTPDCCCSGGHCIDDDWCNASSDRCLGPCNKYHDKTWGDC